MVRGSAAGLADGVASWARTFVQRSVGIAAMPPDRMRNRLRSIFTGTLLHYLEPLAASAQLVQSGRRPTSHVSLSAPAPPSPRAPRVAAVTPHASCVTVRRSEIVHSAAQQMRAWGLYRNISLSSENP